LFQFPDEFVSLIASLDETVRLQKHGRDVRGDKIKPVLWDLKRLASQAQRNGWGLYLWESL
jgi:hypothetical protein